MIKDLQIKNHNMISIENQQKCKCYHHTKKKNSKKRDAGTGVSL